MVPFIAVVAPARETRTLDGETLPAEAVDAVVRMISNRQPHRALPLTGSLCTAVAAQLVGSVVQRATHVGRTGSLRLAMPSGVPNVTPRSSATATAGARCTVRSSAPRGGCSKGGRPLRLRGRPDAST